MDITYLIKANIAFSVAFLAWVLLLKREPRFAANRLLLLGIAACSMLAPALPELHAPITTVVIEPPAFTVTLGDVTPGMQRTETAVLIYFAGFVLAVLWFLLRLGNAVRMAMRSRTDHAFSLFAHISLPEGLLAGEREAMLVHERAHVRRGHSFDVFLFELLAIMSWFNPLWRWAIRELRLVHEHEADAEARRAHPDYETVLVAHALGVPAATLVNSFRSQNLKTRINMLQRLNGSRTSGWKFSLMIPVAFVALLGTGWKAVPFRFVPQGPVKNLGEVEVQPEFPGGMEAMSKYLKENAHYPGADQVSDPNAPAGVVMVQPEVGGKVYVQFTVGADGQVGDVSVKRPVRQDLDDEAKRVVKSMPVWKPGMDKGVPVAVRMIIPIIFAPGH